METYLAYATRMHEQWYKSKKEIVELRKKIEENENNFKMQIEDVEIARKKDREEHIRELSEKDSLLENMAAEITKLEQQQQAASEDVEKNKVDEQQEHEVVIKDLQNQLSEMLASNLNLKDIEKQHIQELNNLKENLTAAEEIIKKKHKDMAKLIVITREGYKYRQELERSLESLQLIHDEQKDRITRLETENESFRKDFEMEKQGREAADKESEQHLLDLRALQKINQELIEEHEEMANAYRKRAESFALNDFQITDATAGAASGVSEAEPSPWSSAVWPQPAKNMYSLFDFKNSQSPIEAEPSPWSSAVWPQPAKNMYSLFDFKNSQSPIEAEPSPWSSAVWPQPAKNMYSLFDFKNSQSPIEAEPSPWSSPVQPAPANGMASADSETLYNQFQQLQNGVSNFMALQNINELIGEHQILVNAYGKRVDTSAVNASEGEVSGVSEAEFVPSPSAFQPPPANRVASAAPETLFNNPQWSIETELLPPTSAVQPSPANCIDSAATETFFKKPLKPIGAERRLNLTSAVQPPPANRMASAAPETLFNIPNGLQE